MKRLISILAVSLTLCGCAGFNDPILQNEINSSPFKKYSYDYSTGTAKGILYLISQPSSTEMVSDEYHFLITNQKIDTYKNSITKLTMDYGEYTIQGEDDFFSHLISMKVTLDGTNPVCVTYRGPSDMTETGTFSQVPCSSGAIKYAFNRSQS